MTQRHFETDANEDRMIDALRKKLNKTFAALAREGIRMLHKKEIQDVSKTLLVVALSFYLCSCGIAKAQIPIDSNPVDPGPAQGEGGGGIIAPAFDPGAGAHRFYGKYLFVGHGNNANGTHPFHEHGWVMADGMGHWTLHSMGNNEGTAFNSIAGMGTYQLNKTGAGTETQQNVAEGDCAVMPPPDQLPPPQCADHAAIFISSDGAFGSIVAMEGGTWEVILTRDPEPVPPPGFLASCKLVQGTIQTCNDGWEYPKGWN
jgi:hypothetical protein